MKNEYSTVLKNIKQDILKNITKICNYHNISQGISYKAILKIESVLDFITHFYEFDSLNDKSAKKALVLEFINNEDGNGFLSTFDAFDSSIEKLLFMALKNSMPEKIFQKAYLMPHVQVCNDKYILDIALMERVDSKTNSGCEGVPVIGIECDGYNYHYADPNQATLTAERIREIEMFEGIRVFQYTGKEIYSKNTELAEEFWKYVCDKIYKED